MNVPLMASVARAGENTGLNTVDAYIVSSQSDNNAITEDVATQVVPDGGNATPVEDYDFEPPSHDCSLLTRRARGRFLKEKPNTLVRSVLVEERRWVNKDCFIYHRF